MVAFGRTFSPLPPHSINQLRATRICQLISFPSQFFFFGSDRIQQTGDQKYLNLATPFLRTALNTFAPTSASSIIAEPCESYTCSRDAKGFKAILVRNIAYLYRETQDEEVRGLIKNVLESSLEAMVERSCDTQWNCGSNWVSFPTRWTVLLYCIPPPKKSHRTYDFLHSLAIRQSTPN